MFHGLFLPGLKLLLSCKGTCPAWHPRAAPWVLYPSVCPCSALGLCHGGLTCLLCSHKHGRDLPGAFLWSQWVANIHLSWGHQSILGASVPLQSVLGQRCGSVSPHITGPSLWLPWPVTIQINNHNKNPCASLGK